MPFPKKPVRGPRARKKRSETPDVRQGEHAECGLAALAIALGYHGTHVPLAELRERAGSTLFGSTIRQLRDLALAYGFEASARRVEPDAMERLGLPLIAHMRFIHFVVIERVSGEGIHINDPSVGPMIMKGDEFARDFTGIVLSVSPGNSVARGKPFSLSAALRSAFRGQAIHVVFACLASMASAGAFATGIWFLVHENANVPAIATGLLLAALLGKLAAIFLMEQACLGVRNAWRRRVFAALAKTGNDYYLFAKPEQTLAQFSALEGLQETEAPKAVLFFLWTCAALATGLTLAPAAVLPVAALCVLQIALVLLASTRRGGLITRFGHGRMPVDGVDAGYLADSDIYRIGRTGDALFARLAGLHAFRAVQSLRTMEARLRLDSLIFGLDVVRIAIPLHLVAFGQATSAPASLLGLVLAVASCAMLRRIDRGLHVQPLKDALHRLNDLPPVQKLAIPPQSSTPVVGTLCVREAGWRASNSAAPVLTGLSLSVAPGEVLVACGPPGSGTTSFARLLCGMLAPTVGTITLEGRSLAALPPTTAILVDHHLFVVPATLRDNLNLGDHTIDDARMNAALALVGLDGVLEPRGGLDCILKGDRPRFSGGQLRRIMIARALCRSPRVLVLDEALDNIETELAETILMRLRALDIITIVTTKNRALTAAADHVLFLGRRM